MTQVVGLSHIVFTTPYDQLQHPVLASRYGKGERYRFDHAEARKDLLRTPGQATQLTLYQSLAGDLPALETVYSESQHLRPSGSFGLLLPESSLGEADEEVTTEVGDASMPEVIAADVASSALYLEEIGCLLAGSPLLEEHRARAGMWLILPELSRAVEVFTRVLGAKLIDQDARGACLLSRVVNRTFSSFLWVIRLDSSMSAGPFYNDDPGFSTIGWMARSIDPDHGLLNELGLKQSPTFSISMNKRSFNSLFVYDHLLPSHEILAVG